MRHYPSAAKGKKTPPCTFAHEGAVIPTIHHKRIALCGKDGRSCDVFCRVIDSRLRTSLHGVRRRVDVR